MITLVLTEVAKLTALALPITNGAKGIVSIPLPGELSIFGIISNISSSTTGNKFIFSVPVLSGFLTLYYKADNPNRYIFRYDDGISPVFASVLLSVNLKYFAATVDGSNITININGTEGSVSKIGDPSVLLADDITFFSYFNSTPAQASGNIKDFRIYDFVLNANEIEYLLP
jgi:hypothetical protein